MSLTTCKYHDMNAPRLSEKEGVILRLLVERGEMYGLQMVRASDELKRGTVYVTLNRMADKGYVESRRMDDDPTPGLPRRLYRATGRGARVLDLWQRYRAAAAAALEEGWAT